MSLPPRTEIPRLVELSAEIETQRLRLRPVAISDADALWPIVSDKPFPKYMSWNAHTDKTETVAFLEEKIAARNAGTDLTWAIERDGKAVGLVGLHDIRWHLAAWRVDRAELGYWIAPAEQGRGLMTEAVRAIVRFAFEEIGLHKITVGCVEDNRASHKVIKKIGFRYTGRLEDDVWRDGVWHTHLRFELTQTVWSDVSTTMPISRLPPT